MKRGDVVRLRITGRPAWDKVYGGRVAIVRYVWDDIGVVLMPPPDDVGPIGFFWLDEVEPVAVISRERAETPVRP